MGPVNPTGMFPSCHRSSGVQAHDFDVAYDKDDSRLPAKRTTVITMATFNKMVVDWVIGPIYGLHHRKAATPINSSDVTEEVTTLGTRENSQIWLNRRQRLPTLFLLLYFCSCHLWPVSVSLKCLSIATFAHGCHHKPIFAWTKWLQRMGICRSARQGVASQIKGQSEGV